MVELRVLNIFLSSPVALPAVSEDFPMAGTNTAEEEVPFQGADLAHFHLPDVKFPDLNLFSQVYRGWRMPSLTVKNCQTLEVFWVALVL